MTVRVLSLLSTVATLLLMSTTSATRVLPLAFPGPLPFPEGEGPGGTTYKTAYRCEGEEMTISCRSSEVIQVIRANYGRFSIAICNKHGYTDWSVNCMSPRTTRVLQTECDGERSCTMPVNSQVFGDPCPATHKYVEVHYACAPRVAATTTKRPLPPWFLQSGAGDLWNNPILDDVVVDGGLETPKTTASTASASSALTSTTLSTAEDEGTVSRGRKPILVTGIPPPKADSKPEVVLDDLSVRIPITTPKATTTTTTTTTTRRPSTTTTTEKTTQASQSSTVASKFVNLDVAPNFEPSEPMCPPFRAQGILWNWTLPGQVATSNCPQGSIGTAKFSCTQEGYWELSPDMLGCKSLQVSQLEDQVREEGGESAIASRLAHLSGGSLSFSGDLKSSVEVMRTVVQRLQYKLQTEPEKFNGKTYYVQEVVQNVLRSAANILDSDIWNDMSAKTRSELVTHLLQTMEENAFLLADVTDKPEILQEAASNMMMTISVLDSAYLNSPGTNRTLHFPEKSTTSVNARKADFSAKSSKIWLPKTAMRDSINHRGQSKAAFLLYQNVHRLTRGADFYPDGKRPVQGSAKYTPIGKVISASVGRDIINLEEPVRIHFDHITSDLMYDDMSGKNPQCVFWDYDLHGWSGRGCRLISTSADGSVCECDHLTNFGLILSDTNEKIPIDDVTTKSHEKSYVVVEIVTYVAVAVCALFVVIILLKFHSQIRKLLAKYNCLVCLDDDRARSKVRALDNQTGPPPKSSSFYSPAAPMPASNMLTHITSNQQPTPEPVTGTKDPTRLSQYIMAQTSMQYPGLIQQHLERSTHSTPSHQPNPHHQTMNPYSFTNQAVTRSFLTLGSSDQQQQQPAGNITLNPYAAATHGELEGLAATRRLRDSVYMSPQLVQLTNTLRRGKKVCQPAGHEGSDSCEGGHVNDSTMLPEKEVVFRAVSPHGHVYWEIDPTRGVIGNMGQEVDPQPEPTVIVNPFADVNLLQSPNSKTSLMGGTNPASLNSSPGLAAHQPSRMTTGPGERFSSLRAKSNKLNAKLQQQQQHYQLHSRPVPGKDSSSASSSTSSTSGLSSAATASSTASPPPAAAQFRTQGGRASSSPLNATVDSILNSWSKQRHV